MTWVKPLRIPSGVRIEPGTPKAQTKQTVPFDACRLKIKSLRSLGSWAAIKPGWRPRPAGGDQPLFRFRCWAKNRGVARLTRERRLTLETLPVVAPCHPGPPNPMARTDSPVGLPPSGWYQRRRWDGAEGRARQGRKHPSSAWNSSPLKSLIAVIDDFHAEARFVAFWQQDQIGETRRIPG